jgi:hypothetical protein
MLIGYLSTNNAADDELEQCLSSAKMWLDKIVVTDNSSVDATVKIAQRYTRDVLSVKEKISFDFSYVAWEHLKQHAKMGDWIVQLNQNQVATPGLFINQMIDQSTYDVLGAIYYNMWSTHSYRVDTTWKPFWSSFMYRFHPAAHFEEGLPEPDYVSEMIRQNKVYKFTGITVLDYKYSSSDKRIKACRFGENSSIMDRNPVLIPL